MNEVEFKNLLEEYRQGRCSEDEKAQLESWLTFGHFEGNTISETRLNELLDKLGKRLPLAHKTYKLWFRFVAAAAITIIVSLSLYYTITTRKKGNLQVPQYVQDIAPGKIGATLTLANGKKIILSDAVNGELANAAGVVVSKSANGQLIYKINDLNAVTEEIHTLSTDKGETYQVQLPDGSLVHLNAASSLTYSASLINNGNRVVKLQGEAYFEVRADKAHPFIVQTGKHKVEVLGTHFNIMAYPDEPVIKTTLLEGVVKVSNDRSLGVLSQGQESTFDGSNLTIKNVNVDDAIAWKNGYFLFTNNDVETAMRKISLWYDVDVRYKGNIKQYILGGRISRTKTLKELIQILESTKKIKIKLEGRVLTVMP